jgi:Uma2 family endonuclease
LPELVFDLSNGRAKPDTSICNINKINWLRDVIGPTQPPLIAIEILSPRQALSDLTDIWLDVYFPSGVATVWVIIPQFKQITVFTALGQRNIYTGILKDDPTGISLDLAELFA